MNINPVYMEKKGGWNPYCDCCKDTGKIGFIFRKVCPQCNGNPMKYFMSLGRPPAPGGSNVGR